MERVMVVEDDVTIGAVLESGLLAEGYEVHWQRSGTSALVDGRQWRPTLVLLDLGLPDIDGLDVCRELRVACPDSVIVILTARRNTIDVVSGLESGADDFLVKPFKVVEVLARVRAHLRRARKPVDADLVPDSTTIGFVTVDRISRTVMLQNAPIRLRTKEFDLLERLFREPDVALSRDTLMRDVWGVTWPGSTKTLDVHLTTIRRRLIDACLAQGLDPAVALPVITALRGHGYRLDPPAASS